LCYIICRNIKMYSRIYVASYQRKYFWRNILNKEVHVKSAHSRNCYLNIFMNLNNFMQCGLIIKYWILFTHIIFFSYSKTWLSNIFSKYLQTDHNSKLGDIFKLSSKINDKYLGENSSPKAEHYIFFLMPLCCDSHIRQ
jgi:hypothetical protein